MGSWNWLAAYPALTSLPTWLWEPVKAPRLNDRTGPGPYASNVRDIEEIDSELGLLLAIRNMAREAEGGTPNASRIDALLDERSAATFSGAQTETQVPRDR